MARPRPEKKPERNAGGQLPLPTPRQPASSSTTRVLPMQLMVGATGSSMRPGNGRSRYGLIPPQAARTFMRVSGEWINR